MCAPGAPTAASAPRRARLRSPRRPRSRALPRCPRRPARLPLAASPTTRRSTRTSTSSTSAPSTATTCATWSGRCARPRTTARPSSCTRSRRRAAATSRPSRDVADQFHAVGQIDPETGESIETSTRPSWTSRVRRRDRDRSPTAMRRIVGITAAMLRPTGLHKLAEKYPGPGARCRHRRAARGHLGRRARLRRHCTRSSPSTPPSSTAPSTRCSWMSPCTRPASPSCSTAPA